MKIRRQHADNGVRPRAQRDGFPDNVWIAGKPFLPKSVAEDGDVILSVHLFFRRKEPAKQRLDLHDVEETVANLRAENSLRLARAGEDRTKIAVGADLAEDLIARP